jgi:cellulose synthase/poly-beta-1,6-N-acetylglucosamine synthase-like glycosyltransferase
MILKFFFWVPALLILHTYVVYPLLLLILDKIIKKERTHRQDNFYPKVSVLMSVHNEEKVIEEKIKALYNTDYPADKLEVIVGSDNSSDRTNERLQEMKNNHKNLILKTYTERIGKPAVINDLAEKSSGEILIITDANVMPAGDTIRKLVSNFSDESVGLADTRLINTGLKRDGIAFPEVAYISFESRLKHIEGKLWGTMMGPFGGFYAIRKNLYKPTSGNTLADDFMICLNVIAMGKTALSDPAAMAFEDVPNNLKDEFVRKIRISAGNFQNLVHFSSLLLRPFSVFSFCFISHKVLRWLTPFFWLILIFTNILLLKSSFLYLLFFFLQVIFIILPPLDMLLKRINLNLVPLRFFTHLYFMNIALFVGFVKFLQGIDSGIWEPTKRYQ